ncbi:unnamed protein product, partial [Ectocarpus sp. 4 AP-2014]
MDFLAIRISFLRFVSFISRTKSTIMRSASDSMGFFINPSSSALNSFVSWAAFSRLTRFLSSSCSFFLSVLLAGIPAPVAPCFLRSLMEAGDFRFGRVDFPDLPASSLSEVSLGPPSGPDPLSKDRQWYS